MWRNSRAAGLAMLLVLLAAGCDETSKGSGEDEGGTGDASFSATDPDPRDCIFEATDPGDSSYTVPLSVIRLDVPDGEGPPNSLDVQYDGESLTGNIGLFPPPETVTLVSPAAPGDPWSATISFSPDLDRELYRGQHWEIVFSCGSIPTCCDETSRVDVTLNPY
jgi:hypothetical protein